MMCGMEIIFLEYPKCSTCQKARKWLDEQGVAYTQRHITENRPTEAELREWRSLSGLPLRRFFNASGMKYRELSLAARLPGMGEDEQYALLASDGMLVKRPLLIVAGKTVIPGFKAAAWAEALGL